MHFSRSYLLLFSLHFVITFVPVTGLVERVGKLITVKPLSARYVGDIGDVVIGRVLQVGQGRWSVDINHTLNGVLLLNSINLPNGVQRKRTVLDELNMRSFYSENDLISAEVQSVYHDGSISIHTRSQRYGKLQNGTLVVVPPYLVRRCKSHFITLDCGIFLVLGMNGYIWVSAFPPFIENSASSSTLAPTQSVPTVQTVKGELRQRVSKVCNVISCLAQGIITRPPFVILFIIGKLFLL